MSMLLVGETIKAGTLVLLTRGSYASYGVVGLFRALVDVVVPSLSPSKRDFTGTEEADISLLSTLLEEVPYGEVWRDD